MAPSGFPGILRDSPGFSGILRDSSMGNLAASVTRILSDSLAFFSEILGGFSGILEDSCQLQRIDCQ